MSQRSVDFLHPFCSCDESPEDQIHEIKPTVIHFLFIIPTQISKRSMRDFCVVMQSFFLQNFFFKGPS